MAVTYAVRMILDKDVWRAAEPAFSEFFEAIVVKPEIENNPQSRETIMLVFEERPDELNLRNLFAAVFTEEVPDFTIEEMPDIDWLQHVYDQLPPIEAGRFFVHGAHVETIPEDKIAILIEAAAAFGTGEHPTTKGCLVLFDQYLDENNAPESILDMGCGSGILAIAAARTLLETKTILGVDIDTVSVQVSKEHAADNHVEDRIMFVAGNGFQVAEIKDHPQFDFIFANILAQPLIEMAPKMVAAKPRDIILSGFTEVQKPYVMKAYQPLGFVEHKQVVIGEWIASWLKAQ